MNNSDESPLYRELMAKEYDADIASLLKAESALRRCSASAAAEWDGEEHLNPPQTASLLRYWGFSEVFALHCLRLGNTSGRIALLIHEPPFGHLVTVSATFDLSGELEKLAGRVDKGEPFHLDLHSWDDESGRTLEPRLKDPRWVKAQWMEILEYQTARREHLELGIPGDLLAVVRFRHSRSQAYRKFVTERWYAPSIPTEWRLVCPLDCFAYRTFEDHANSVADRFEAVLKRIKKA